MVLQIYYFLHPKYVNHLNANDPNDCDCVIKLTQSSYFYYIGLVANELNYMKKMREIVIMTLESIDFLINKGMSKYYTHIIRYIGE